MTNDEYSKKLEPRLETLRNLRKQAVSITTGIIGETLFQEDLFFMSAADRCIRLIDGLIPMLEARNLTCSGVLLRVQMDNCMRTYAAFIAEDKNEVIQCIIDGLPIKKLRDKNGNKMSDGYLKDELTKIDNKFAVVYDNASGYVHLSEKAFYQTVDKIEDHRIGFLIGEPLPEKRNMPLLECTDAYIHFVQLHLKLLTAVADSKKRYDTNQNTAEED